MYEGMKIFLTRNINKENNFVNGMKCEVLSLENRVGGALTVRTDMGNTLAIYPITDIDLPPKNEDDKFVGRMVYYPVRLGYASTVHQHQGAELDHVP